MTIYLLSLRIIHAARDKGGTYGHTMSLFGVQQPFSATIYDK